MTLKFYPAHDEIRGSLEDKVILLMQAAKNFKKVANENEIKPIVPRELNAAYNWQGAARVIAEIRDLPENVLTEKQYKCKLLLELADVYLILSEAKMAKLEAVRLALIGEANIITRGM